MKKKPWGIFVPLKIQKIIYPKEKIEYEGPYVLATLSRRISVLLSYYILNKFRVSPNSVSFFSFFVSFLSVIFLFNSNYIAGSSLACLWVLLDNIDGELARLQNSLSNFGALLEKLNSDIFYVFLFPALAVGLFKDDLISFEILILTFFSVCSFNIFRVLLTNFPKKNFTKKNNSKFLKLVECQFKNSFRSRKEFKFGSLVFYTWRNIFTQCGLNELFFLILSILNIFNINYLHYFLIFFTYSYLAISLLLFLGLIIISFIGRLK